MSLTPSGSGQTQGAPSSEFLAPGQSTAHRNPSRADVLIFFFGIPVILGFLFALVGTRLIHGLPFMLALTYMILHMFIAWWVVSLGATIIKYIFRNWQPPCFAICVMGYVLAIIPAAFLYQELGEIFASISPVFAENRKDNFAPGWDLAYLLHFVRFSIPALMLFVTAVYGYRMFAGITWFSYQNKVEDNYGDQGASVSSTAATQKAVAGLIDGSKLPADAEILAIKAEQHYIQIWSDQGKDLVRYRFKDLEKTLGACHGVQVHRSWWVNLDQVQTCKNDGRKLELLMRDDLTVPVSLSHKHAVINLLKS